MKKNVYLIGALIWIIIAIAALAVLVVSISGASISKNLPEWLKFASLGDSLSGAIDSNTPLLKEETLSLDNINEINVGTQYQSIKMALIDGGNITIRHYDQESAPAANIESSSGAININIPHRNLISINMMAPRLEIDLPREYSGGVKLETSSGTISLDEHAEWGQTTLSSSSGSIRINSGLKCGDINISSNSGSVNMGNVVAQTIKSSSTSGLQRYEDIIAVSDVSITTSSGSINCSNIEAADLKLRSTSGTIRAEGINAIGNVDISTSSASQHVSALNAGTYDINSTSGAIRYDGLCGRGSINCTSGSINCEDLDVRGDVTIISSSGTQRLSLAPDQNFEVKISVTSGSIRASGIDLYYSDNQGKNAFGAVGDGSMGTLTIRSTSGSININ